MSTASTSQSTASNLGQRDWLETLARLGYASRGVIYLIIGGLALLAAFGQGGETIGTKGAIQEVFYAPLGWLLVMAIAIGLVGYSIWRFCQSVLDADRHGTDGKAWVIRGGLLVSSVTHLLLAIWAGKLAIGSASGESDTGAKETMVTMLMSKPFGQWLVGIAGVVLIGVGIAQFAKGHGEKFEKHFTWADQKRRKLIYFCKFGLYARGVIFAIIGGFVIYAAYTTNASNAGGLAEALAWLRDQAFGPWLLAIVAAGLVCFGLYSIVEAIYRRVQTPA